MTDHRAPMPTTLRRNPGKIFTGHNGSRGMLVLRHKL
jgi:hypothetical protein